MPRIPLFDPHTMTPEQAQIYDAIVGGARGRLVGPLRVALHRPDLADHWQRLGEALRYRTSLPQRLVELAILVTARRWNSQVEWYIHAREAAKCGLDEAVAEAIRTGEAPRFIDPDEADVYEFARQLQQDGDVGDALYDRLRARHGTVGMVELSSVVGYYTLVSMTLNVHAVPLPDEAGRAPLSDGATLSVLPPAIALEAAGPT